MHLIPRSFVNSTYRYLQHSSCSQAFYNLLDNGGAPIVGHADRNKENVVYHCSEIVRAQHHPCNSSSANPYFSQQTKQIVTPYPSNPYNQTHRHMQYSVPMNERNSPIPHTASASSSNPSTTLTPDQIRRIEENRQRALAIRMNKQTQMP